MWRSLTRGFIVVSILAVASWGQQDRLQGRWEGTVQSLQGERQAVATFSKEGDGYKGTISGLRGDMSFKEIKVEGDKMTAKAEVDSPQGPVVINYEFILQGETLKGKGEVDFGGQTFSFTYDLKRTGAAQQAEAGQQPQQRQQQQPGSSQRPVVPQPLQKQTLDYFAGKWQFKWLGRDSPLGPGGPREGIISYIPAGDGKFMEGRTETPGEYRFTIVFDAEKKILATFERLSNGTEILGLGDWSSPLGIRFSIAPIKLKGQTLRLKRTISVVAAHSYTVTEEFSVDDGPFQRLGNGVFTKVETKAAKE